MKEKKREKGIAKKNGVKKFEEEEREGKKKERSKQKRMPGCASQV